MVKANTLRRYQQVIERVGYDQARELAETQDLEEIRQAFNAKPTTADTTLLAYQRILKNLVNQANNPEQANQRVLRRIEFGWGQEVQELRQTIANLNATIELMIETNRDLREEIRQLRGERDHNELVWAEEKQELMKRIKELEEKTKTDEIQEELDDLDLEEDIVESENQADQPNESLLVRDLSYERTAVDGTKIKHFKREINFSTEKTSNDIINNANEYSDYVFSELEEFVKSVEYVKIYVNLVNENGQGITQSISHGFVATKDLDLSENRITDLIVDCASKSTSGNKHSSLTINATGF